MDQAKLSKYLLIFGGFFFIFLERYATSITVLNIFLLVLFAGWMLVWGRTLWKNSGNGLQQTPLDWGILAFAIALCLSTINSIDPSRSIRFLWGWLAALVSFYFFVTILRTHLKQRETEVIDVLIAVTTIFLVLGWVDFGMKVPGYWQFYTATGQMPEWARLQGFTFSSNSLGFLVAILFVLSLGRFLFRPAERFGWGALLIFSAPIIVGSGSSGAVMSAGLGGITLIILYFWPAIERRLRQVSSSQKGLLSAGLLITTFIVGWLGWRYVQQDPGFADRLFIWGIGLEMFREHPIFGAGLNTYSTFYNAASLKSHLFWHAHNYWINILGEVGLFGGIVAVGLLGQTVLLIIKNFGRIQQSVAGKICLAALVAIVAHSLVETLIFSTMGLTALFLALLLVICLPDARASTKNWIGFAWPAIGLILLVLGFQNVRYRNEFDRSIDFAQSGNWPAAAEVVDALINEYPLQESSFLYVSAFAHGMLAEQDTEHRALAIQRYEQLIVLEPSWAANYANLAWLYQLEGDTEKALENYTTAADIQPNQSLFALNGLQLQGESGELAGSDWLTMEGLYFVARSWHQSPYWSQFFDMPQLFESAKTRGCFNSPNRVPCSTHRSTELTKAWELLAIGDQEQAKALFDAFILENGVAADTSSVLGQSLASGVAPEAQSNIPSDGRGSTPTIDPFMNLLWESHAELEGEQLENDLNLILNQTAQGLGRLGFDSYPKLMLARPALPYDLLPGLQCFTVDDNWAWQLSTLADWYTTSGRDDLAEKIDDALAGPDRRGIAPCTRPLPTQE